MIVGYCIVYVLYYGLLLILWYYGYLFYWLLYSFSIFIGINIGWLYVIMGVSISCIWFIIIFGMIILYIILWGYDVDLLFIIVGLLYIVFIIVYG